MDSLAWKLLDQHVWETSHLVSSRSPMRADADTPEQASAGATPALNGRAVLIAHIGRSKERRTPRVSPSRGTATVRRPAFE